MTQVLKVLMLGDSVGKTGRALFARHIQSIKTEHSIDAVIVNGENSGDEGVGITPEIVAFFKKQGADVVTSGNHIWDDKAILPYFEKNTDLLRPANFPRSCPGVGMTFFTCKGFQVGIMNLMGRVFMSPVLDCPFMEAENLLKESAAITPIMLVDFHAAATSEKLGITYFLEGKVTAVVGTHTHTLTNDARILPGGTAYISDLGMSGSLHSAGGFNAQGFLKKFMSGMKNKAVVETQPPYIMTGAIITIDPTTGKALAIEKIIKLDDQPLEELS